MEKLEHSGPTHFGWGALKASLPSLCYCLEILCLVNLNSWYLSIIYVHVSPAYDNQTNLFCLQPHHFIRTQFLLSLVMYHDSWIRNLRLQRLICLQLSFSHVCYRNIRRQPKLLIQRHMDSQSRLFEAFSALSFTAPFHMMWLLICSWVHPFPFCIPPSLSSIVHLSSILLIITYHSH